MLQWEQLAIALRLDFKLTIDCIMIFQLLTTVYRVQSFKFILLGRIVSKVTVEVMIMSRYRCRPVTVALPLQRYRDSPSATVTDRYGPFTNVTGRY
jgi:hypothetical protein